MIKPKKLSKRIFYAPLLLLAVCGQLLFAAPVLAATAGTPCNPPGSVDGGLTCSACSSQGCAWVSEGDLCKNTIGDKGKVSQSKVSKCLNQSPLVHDIQNIVNFLSAAVGVVVIAVIIVGGIQYSMAGDNANALGAAKRRITNGLIALFAFLFAWAFLQWLIPGGIFG